MNLTLTTDSGGNPNAKSTDTLTFNASTE